MYIVVIILGFITLCLMFFQAGLYYEFFRKTSSGLVPVLGGLAFFLISFVEAIAFYFVTSLTLTPSATLIVRLCRSPFVLLALALRFIQRFLEIIPRRNPKSQKSSAPTQESQNRSS